MRSVDVGAEAQRASGGRFQSYSKSSQMGTRQAWEWIQTGKLQADVEQVPLKDVASAWQRTDRHGKRLVLIP